METRLQLGDGPLEWVQITKKSQKHQSCRKQKWKYPKLWLSESLLAVNHFALLHFRVRTTHSGFLIQAHCCCKITLGFFVPPSFFHLPPRLTQLTAKLWTTEIQQVGILLSYISAKIQHSLWFAVLTASSLKREIGCFLGQGSGCSNQTGHVYSITGAYDHWISVVIIVP